MPYLEGDGVRIFYVRRGVGTPSLVFVHGFACSHWIWERQIEAFADARAILACDLRGHGTSSRPATGCTVESLGADVAALIRTLGPRPSVVVIGHSLGCRVALQAYSESRDSIVGLILIDGSWSSPAEFSQASQTVEDQIRRVGYTAFVRNEFEQMFLDSSNAELRRRIVAEASALPEHVGKALFLQTIEWDALRMEPVLAEVTVPVLLLQSTAVMANRTRASLRAGMSTPWLDLVRQRVPPAQIRLITGVGHFSMLEASDRVNDAVAGFIEPLPAHHPSGSKNDPVG